MWPAALVMLLASAVGVYYSSFLHSPASLKTSSEYAILGGKAHSKSGEPVVYTFCDLFSATDAQHIIELARPNLGPAHILNPAVRTFRFYRFFSAFTLGCMFVYRMAYSVNCLVQKEFRKRPPSDEQIPVRADRAQHD
eukprot:SAG31_NODE_4232_length_3436_cov_1.384477_7_plen_138_part_00